MSIAARTGAPTAEPRTIGPKHLQRNPLTAKMREPALNRQIDTICEFQPKRTPLPWYLPSRRCRPHWPAACRWDSKLANDRNVENGKHHIDNTFRNSVGRKASFAHPDYDMNPRNEGRVVHASPLAKSAVKEPWHSIAEQVLAQGFLLGVLAKAPATGELP